MDYLVEWLLPVRRYLRRDAVPSASAGFAVFGASWLAMCGIVFTCGVLDGFPYWMRWPDLLIRTVLLPSATAAPVLLYLSRIKRRSLRDVIEMSGAAEDKARALARRFTWLLAPPVCLLSATLWVALLQWVLASYSPTHQLTIGAILLVATVWLNVSVADMERAVRANAHRAGGDPLCASCGYNLRGQTTQRCPECGTPFDPGKLRATEPQAAKSDTPTEGIS